jgi:hypothetical protein
VKRFGWAVGPVSGRCDRPSHQTVEPDLEHHGRAARNVMGRELARYAPAVALPPLARAQ